MGKYFNIKELSDYLHESKSTIYKKTSKNEIPFIKVRKRLLFKIDDIDQWLNQHRQPTISEMQQDVDDIIKLKIKKNNVKIQ